MRRVHIGDMTQITPAQYIRTHVFRCETQEEFAHLLGYNQSQISRFERRTLSRQAQERIRDAAKKKKIRWDDRWFFEVPKSVCRDCRDAA
jgi:transcriptional regulator with XRE-family HTH domain